MHIAVLKVSRGEGLGGDRLCPRSFYRIILPLSNEPTGVLLKDVEVLNLLKPVNACDTTRLATAAHKRRLDSLVSDIALALCMGYPQYITSI